MEPKESIPSVHVSQLPAPYQVRFADDQEHQWLGDEPEALGGGNTGPSPERLILASLGACTAITLRMYAARKGWALSDVQVELQLNPEGKPASGNDIRRVVHLSGELDEAQRAQLLKIANACPMHKLLTGEVRVATSAA